MRKSSQPQQCRTYCRVVPMLFSEGPAVRRDLAVILGDPHDSCQGDHYTRDQKRVHPRRYEGKHRGSTGAAVLVPLVLTFFLVCCFLANTLSD